VCEISKDSLRDLFQPSEDAEFSSRSIPTFLAGLFEERSILRSRLLQREIDERLLQHSLS
jgi:hypothetical protein